MTIPSAPENGAGARLTEPERKQVVNRLRRARGQIDAVITMIDADGSCEEVVTQLAAASRALDKAGYKYLAGAMRECLLHKDHDVSPASIERLFLMLA
jgi:DNA-binding FrmR family transcriptional regulator